METKKEAMDLLFSAFCEGESFTTGLDWEREKAFLKLDGALAGLERERELSGMATDLLYIAMKSGFVSGFLAAKDLLM